jgi:protein TonB
MTSLLMSLSVDNRRELQRWLICGAVVVMAHAGLAVALANWHDFVQGDETGNALVIDLEPLQIDVADHPTEEVPPGPEQAEAEATPEKPVKEVQEKVEQMVRADNPDVVLPEEVKPEHPKEVEVEPSAPDTTAPQLPKLNAKSIPTWQLEVKRLLARNIRYPRAAKREYGTTQLAIILDPQGRVTASRVVKSSGSPVLDDEALNLVNRVQPYPPPPPQLADIELTLPIGFDAPKVR